MRAERIDRINELSRLARERSLTEAEAAERAELRGEYLEAMRASLRSQLDSIAPPNPGGAGRARNLRPSPIIQETDRGNVTD